MLDGPRVVFLIVAVDVERTQLEGAPFLVFKGNGVEQRGLEGGRDGPNPFIERIG